METRKAAPSAFSLSWKILVPAVLAALALWSLITLAVDRSFIYFPAPYPDGHYLSAARAPYIRDIWFRAEDKVLLHGWYLKADSPLATVIYSHGNAGNLSYGFDLYRRLRAEGLNVFAYDYRGYGRSEGTPTENGLYKDARAAYARALELDGVDSNKIVLWGFSLGGAVSVRNALQHRPAGIILESAFTSLHDLGQIHYPSVVVSLLLHTRFSTIEEIPKIQTPILFIHGTMDEIVPLDQAHRLYEAARPPKTIYEVPGAGHNDVSLVGGDEYFRRVMDFIRSLPTR